MIGIKPLKDSISKSKVSMETVYENNTISHKRTASLTVRSITPMSNIMECAESRAAAKLKDQQQCF